MTHAAPYPPVALPTRDPQISAGTAAPDDAGAIGYVVFVGQTPPAGTGISARLFLDAGHPDTLSEVRRNRIEAVLTGCGREPAVRGRHEAVTGIG